MTDVTNILNKLSGSDVHHFKIIKSFAWESRQIHLDFYLLLLNANMGEYKGEKDITMKFLVRNYSIKNGSYDDDDFKYYFEMYDAQEDLKDMMLDTYKLSFLSIRSQDDIHPEYQFLKL
jgi:hypothetical protein